MWSISEKKKKRKINGTIKMESRKKWKTEFGTDKTVKLN